MDKKFDDFSKKITRWIGSPSSLIMHSLFFAGIFFLKIFGVSSDEILLILTTIVSLEAIYLSIFIQMTVNRHTKELKEVSKDVEEIQESVSEIEESVEEIEEDVGDIVEDIEDGDKTRIIESSK